MRLPDGTLHPRSIGGPGAAPNDTLVWDGTRAKWAAPAGGSLSGRVARMELWGGGGAYRTASIYVPDEDYQALGYLDLNCEFTATPGEVLHVQNNGMSSVPTVDGTVWGQGRIQKVRDAAGAVVTPSTWHLGSWTWDAASGGGSYWDGADAATADFAIDSPYSSASGVTRYTGFQAILGGTYRIILEVYPA